jgi:hypothetical protein
MKELIIKATLKDNGEWTTKLEMPNGAVYFGMDRTLHGAVHNLEDALMKVNLIDVYGTEVE